MSLLARLLTRVAERFLPARTVDDGELVAARGARRRVLARDAKRASEFCLTAEPAVGT